LKTLVVVVVVVVVVVLLDSAIGKSQCATSSGGRQSSELAGVWKGAVLLRL